MSLEFIMHGTGTSSAIPNVSCLTSSSSPRCPTCWSTRLPSGRKNHRRNTGALIRVHHDLPGENNGGGDPVIVIDAGKTFLSAAVELFPQYGLREIAAVVITHAHADAMNGLDDLRGWTLRGQIQDHIDIYLSRETFQEVKRCFPYLVAKEFATGGGDVPEFRYHFFEDGVPFTIRDLVTITPVAVEHGRFFSTPTPPLPVSVPVPTPPRSPILSRLFPQGVATPPETPMISPAEPTEAAIIPYLAYGFIIDQLVPERSSEPGARIVYLSDVSHIPDRSWDILTRPVPAPPTRSKSKESIRSVTSKLSTSSIYEPEPPVPSASSPPPPVPSLVIVDCLRPLAHSSHYGLAQAYSTTRRLLFPSSPANTDSAPRVPGSPTRSGAMSPKSRGRAYFVGMSHEFTAAEWDRVGDVLAGKRRPNEFTELIKDGAPIADNWKDKDGGVRPAYVARALDALVNVVPSLKGPGYGKGTSEHAEGGEDDEDEDEVLARFAEEPVKESERVFLRPAWDGIRLFLRGGRVYDEDPADIALGASRGLWKS